MRVHVVDCCPMRPIGTRSPVPARCLVVELDGRVVLVDTGIGIADIADPLRRLGRPWVTMSRPLLQESAAAVRQVEALGYAAADVTDVVLTHLDLDHAGGVGDFPSARVHVHAREAEAARAAARRIGAQRARYQPLHWQGADLREHPPGTAAWHGIEGCVAIPELDDRVLLVPLPGHSAGHCGVAVEAEGGWLLHSGDALFRGVDGPRMPTTIRLFDQFILDDARQARRSRASVMDVAADGIDVITSHAS